MCMLSLSMQSESRTDPRQADKVMQNGTAGRKDMKHIGTVAIPVAAALVIAALCGCEPSDSNATKKINGSVRMAAGRPAEALATVNGSVRLDENAVATSASTVNGSVHLGAHSTADSANSVNGAISLDAGARVAGSINTVTGTITLASGADIGGTVANVTGNIELDSAHVGGALKTVAGNIRILGASRIDGGIIVEKPNNELTGSNADVPKIIVGPGVIVQGEMRFERKVELHVSDKASVGVITGATAQPFVDATLP